MFPPNYDASGWYELSRAAVQPVTTAGEAHCELTKTNA
jgi:hypothetical protein